MEETKWKLDEAVHLITQLEPHFRKKNMHLGLTGSVLYGMGTGKDLDVVVYAHGPGDALLDEVSVRDLLLKLKFGISKFCSTKRYPRGVLNACTTRGPYKGRRIDFIMFVERTTDNVKVEEKVVKAF